VAFANRVRLVNKATQKRILPIIMSDNYVTLMPGEEKSARQSNFRKCIQQCIIKIIHAIPPIEVFRD